jgi:hypothetical protein
MKRARVAVCSKVSPLDSTKQRIAFSGPEFLRNPLSIQ